METTKLKDAARDDFVRWVADALATFMEHRGERFKDREKLIAIVEVEYGIDLWKGYNYAYKFLFEADDEGVN